MSRRFQVGGERDPAVPAGGVDVPWESPVVRVVVLTMAVAPMGVPLVSPALPATSEGQVTVDRETYDLPSPFFVIATQNPVEQEGTFRLPEAQRDRFVFKTAMGSPDREGERRLIGLRADRTARAPTRTW